MVMAIGSAKRTRGSVTAFLVDRGTPGFEITRVDRAIGSSHDLAEITFTDAAWTRGDRRGRRRL